MIIITFNTHWLMTLEIVGSVALGDILNDSISTCTCITGYENMGPTTNAIEHW